MSWLDGMRHRARWLFRGTKESAELDAELQFHVEMETERLIAAGLDPAKARAMAEGVPGNIARTREAVHDRRGVTFIEDAARDLAYAARGVRRRPGFTLAVIATLALGIGANGAVFSVVNDVLLRPLAFHDPDDLVAVWPNHYVSLREVHAFRAASQTLSIATYAPWTLALTDIDEPTQVPGARVSGNLFAILGVPAALGATIAPDGDRIGTPRVAVIGDALWRAKFGADAAVVGRTVRVDGVPHEIIGVMPASFELYGSAAQLWIPLIDDPSAWYFSSGVSQMLARLSPGSTIENAGAEFRRVVRDVRVDLAMPDDYGADAAVIGLKAHLTGDYSRMLFVLLGTVCGILLITGTNLANLMLARASNRRTELAMRAALGAERGRLLRQLVVEGLLLSGLGAVGGAFAAFAMVAALRPITPQDIPRIAHTAVDGATVLACAGIAVVLAAVFAAAQFVGAGRLSGNRAFGGSAAGSAGGPRVTERAGDALVIVQVALSVTLVIGAALMAQTLGRIAAVDPGFDSNGVLTVAVQPSGPRYRDRAAVDAFYDEVLARVAAMPGVTSVGAIQHLPLGGTSWGASIEVERQPVALGQALPRVGYRIATPGYFGTVRIPVVDGRLFTDGDRAGAPSVALVSETMARRFWPGESAVGKRFRQTTDSAWTTVVGVVGDIHHESLVADVTPDMYRPARQSSMSAYALAIRTSVAPMTLAAPVRSAIWAIDRGVPISRIVELRSLVRSSVGDRRLVAAVLGVFAVLAIVVAAVGVFGVASYAVSRRMREFGIRLAIGATGRAVAGGVLKRGLLSALFGVGVGIGGALVLTRFLDSLVFGIGTTDLATFVGVSAVLVLVALIAVLAPAVRAARVDPIVVLGEG